MIVIRAEGGFNPRTYKQTHTPIVVQGGGGGGCSNPSLGFSLG